MAHAWLEGEVAPQPELGGGVAGHGAFGDESWDPLWVSHRVLGHLAKGKACTQGLGVCSIAAPKVGVCEATCLRSLGLELGGWADIEMTSYMSHAGVLRAS